MTAQKRSTLPPRQWPESFTPEEVFAANYMRDLLDEIHGKRPKLAKALLSLIAQITPSEVEAFIEFLEALTRE